MDSGGAGVPSGEEGKSEGICNFTDILELLPVMGISSATSLTFPNTQFISEFIVQSLDIDAVELA